MGHVHTHTHTNTHTHTQSNTASTKIKPHILSSFGDVAMALGDKFDKYIDIVFSTLTKVPKEIADRVCLQSMFTTTRSIHTS